MKLCWRRLAKDPGQRPTAGELARRIEEVMRIERLALGLVAMGRPHTALRRNRVEGEWGWQSG